MKLTSELLSGVCEKSAELQRLDAVMAHNEVREDLEMLNKQLKGCMGLIDELTIAHESLKAAGYSTEWFDIINKDNNFMAVVDLDMPKFFGGDETKQAACEGAILDTIKKWAKAVWEWIKSFFAKIKKALYWVKGLWVHEGRAPSETMEAYAKVKELVKNSSNPQVAASYKACFDDIETYDPDKVLAFIAGYRGLMEVCVEITADLDPGSPKNRGGGPAAPLTRLITNWNKHQGNFGRLISDEYWTKSNVPPRNRIPLAKDQGFDFNDSNGDIHYAPILGEPGCLIPKFEVGYSQFDAPKQEYWVTNVCKAGEAATKLALDIADAVTKVEKVKKIIEDVKNAILQEHNMAPDAATLAQFEMPLKLYVNICGVLHNLSVRCLKLSSQLDVAARKLRRNLEEVRRDLEGR